MNTHAAINDGVTSLLGIMQRENMSDDELLEKEACFVYLLFH